jgi:hypothetical protein
MSGDEGETADIPGLEYSTLDSEVMRFTSRQIGSGVTEGRCRRFDIR